ncbi:MAG: biopolymer transporter ExbD [Verrucomicrobiae bacterium]|nr:biopolymer transporter ExbD [Verrucomicrobiae bacterium]
MRRRKSSSPFTHGDSPELNISPLIDVAFLLLIYFLVTTTLIKQEADLSMALPGVTRVESSPVPMDQMRIEIAASGAVLVNREPADTEVSDHAVPNLTDRLIRYAAAAKIAQTPPRVVIDCHDEVPEQRFVDVLNACAKAGIEHVSISP